MYLQLFFCHWLFGAIDSIGIRLYSSLFISMEFFTIHFLCYKNKLFPLPPSKDKKSVVISGIQ